MKRFEYCAPTSLEEACQFLYDHPGDSKPLAGGASLIPLLKLDLTEFKHIVDLKRIPNLSFIRTVSEATSSAVSFVEIGALTTHSDVEKSRTLRSLVPLLSDTARGIGHPLVRNRGTLGGSLCHCDPAADYPPTMLTLDAKITIVSRGGNRRTVQAADFFRGTFETSLGNGEILEKITIPVPSPHSKYSFKKLMLGHGDFPLVIVSILADFEPGSSKLKHIAISLGGVSDKAFRLTDAENYLLRCAEIKIADIERAESIAVNHAKPESDFDVSKNYKKRMVGVLTRRCLQEILTSSRIVKEE